MDAKNADKELEALRAIKEALSPLDQPAVRRVLQWASARFLEANLQDALDQESAGADETAALTEFTDPADLFEKANPRSAREKALVIGYWLQYCQGAAEFEAQQVNKHLKNLGHRISNITSALGRLMKTRPQLVVQTKKAGTTKQARKKYKVTEAGKRVVEDMLKENE